TGASPILPPITGLQNVPFQVLRTMDDALALKSAMTGAKHAMVLGGGLIGTHGAENLADAGLKVTLVEAKGQLLPGYFDGTASALIAKAFRAHGIDLVFGQAVSKIRPGVAVLEGGSEIPFDLLLVATGVSPDLSYLGQSGIKTARGILVDDLQCTSHPNIWAAGDCAESSLFQAEATGVAGILPVAVEQGRIAGQSMAGDGAVKPFPGAVSLNTYTFFGQQAISVGRCADDAGCESHIRHDEAQGTYLRIDLMDGRLMGAAAVNLALDPGILWQLILRRTDLGEVKQRFLADPKSIGRLVMAREWK
ncbi:MAG: NAD(P)/FAD-dependent oxidoreductase, partial [Rhodospirillales bacterium]